MKKITQILFFCFAAINLQAQDIGITSGNSVSSFVCSDRKVYVCGNNKTTAGTGLLGFGGTADYYTSFQPVSFPNNIYISQVNSANGSHFLAIDCEGKLWAWGNNSFGQVGNGEVAGAGGFVNAPTRVKASAEIAPEFKDAEGYLIGVKKVYCGNNSSFAILENYDLVAWGQNGMGLSPVGYDAAYGILGIGVLPSSNTVHNVTEAKYVRLPNNQKITSVIQISVGDNCAYALVDYTGSGVGTVYSWGYGMTGILGRNADGTLNPSSSLLVQDAYARQVRYADNTIMNNIVEIAAGDVFCAALDVNNYVWSWGNGGWNNATGNTIVNYTGSDPRRVLKGTTTGASNDGTYLLARSIAAGQGFGMAVTVDKKPVAWGGGGYADGGGYNGGSATGTEYIMYASGLMHSDVIAIYRGELSGFYRRSDGSYWGWGRNAEGQIGFGGSVSNEVLYATKLNSPIGCGFVDPKPFVNLTPSDITVCESSFVSQVLDAGFVISTGLASYYRIDWYKNANFSVPIFTGTGLTGKTYTANSPGSYTAKVTYTGSNVGCVMYEPVMATTTIEAYTQSFVVPTDLTYINDTASVNVKTSSTSSALYSWYPTSESSTVLGTSQGNGAVIIDVSNATQGIGNNKIVYVEESSYASGQVLSKNQGCDLTWTGAMYNLSNGIINQNNSYATGFTVIEPITIQELSFMFRSSIYTINQSGTAAITMGVYGVTSQQNGYIPNNTNLIDTLFVTYVRTRNANQMQDTTVELIAKGEVILQPGRYFIGIRSYLGNGSLYSPKIGYSNCKLPNNIFDDYNGSIINQNLGVSSMSNANSTCSGFVFNVKFKTSQQFCDRKPVQILYSTTVIWNGTAWSPQAPTINDNVIIEDSYSGEGFTCKNLIIRPTIEFTLTGGTLTVTGNLTLQSDATGTATFVDQGGVLDVHGTTTVQQYLTGAGETAPTGRFWYVGAPITGGVSSGFDALGSNRLWYYSEPTHSYTEIADNTTELIPGLGYVARLAATETVSLQGPLVTGEQTYTLSRTGTEHSKRGYHLLANPYPSYVDWGMVQRTNVEPTLWYRTENKNFTMVFDTYNAISAIGTNNNGNGDVTGYLPPMQAFWIRVQGDGNTGELVFDNSMRSHQSGSMLKQGAKQDVVRLHISSDTQSDELILLFNEQATDGIDVYDSEKMFVAEPALPQMYAAVESKKLVIHGMQSYSTNPEIPVGVEIGTSGIYTISAAEIEGLEGVSVVLEDKHLQKFQDLHTGTYTFTTDALATDERFVLHLKAETQSSDVTEVLQSQVHISTQQQTIVIECSGAQGTARVQDIAGRILTIKDITSPTTRIAVQPGVYVVQVITNSGTYTRRVVVLE